VTSRIAFAMIFLFFHVMGASYYVIAPSAFVGFLLWTAFVVLGTAAAKKAYLCHTRQTGDACA
jgi:hypothetical protein